VVQPQPDVIVDGVCKERQRVCRDRIYGAMFPRWVAVVVLAVCVSAMGGLFYLVLGARAESAEARTDVACQARDISHIAASFERQEKAIEGLREDVQRLIEMQQSKR